MKMWGPWNEVHVSHPQEGKINVDVEMAEDIFDNNVGSDVPEEYI